MIWSVIGITALAGMGGTGMGGLLSCLFRKDSIKTVSLLLSFAAGVMTSVVCFDLLTEALQIARQSGYHTAELDWSGHDSPTWVLMWYERQGFRIEKFGNSYVLLKMEI